MREKTNFRGGNLGHGDSALSKAGAVTSGDYSRPVQLKHYHKCAPGLGRSVSEDPGLPDRPHHQQQLPCHRPLLNLALELGGIRGSIP